MGNEIKRLKPELLAPAGNMDALKAAVQNGADAIYLGASAFNARQFAGNFDGENLKKGIDYAHVRGVNIYLTMNTLISDSEMQEAADMAYKAFCFGIDGIIVQDIGFTQLVRRGIPQLPLHASTQMTVYNLNGVKALGKMGFERVVLSRECSIDEIKEITDNTSVEIEVFVHGALCVSYSGQCLMSSMIGGRSGNRGKCAQPCRMRYSLVNNENGKGLDKPEYLMSPKDLCSVDFLPDVINAGVASLKIEGRMKTPEYVGVVVGTYRRYLDLLWDQKEGYKVQKKDFEDLSQIFNRGGFTSGYMKGKPGGDLICREKPKNWGIPVGEIMSYDFKKRQAVIRLKDKLCMGDGIEVWNGEDESPGTVVSVLKQNGAPVQQAKPGEALVGELKGQIQKGNRVFRTSSKELNENIRKSFAENSEQRKVPLTGSVTVRLALPIRVDIEDEHGNKAGVTGNIPTEKAVKRELDEERLREQFEKTGSTPFIFSNLTISLEKGISLPVSELNLVRRTALEQLEAMRALKHADRCLGADRDRDKAVNEIFLPQDAFDNPAKTVKKDRPKISLYFYRLKDAAALTSGEVRFGRVYIPLSGYPGNKEQFIRTIDKLIPAAEQVFISFPSVSRGNYDRYIGSVMKEIADLPVDGFLIGNPGMLQNDILRYSGKLISGDISFNTFNALTSAELKKSGINSITLSPELTLQQIKGITGSESAASGNLEYEIIIHGRLPVMTSEYCPVGSSRGRGKGDRKCQGDCRAENHYLKDRTGAMFPVITDPIDCRSIIFNSNDLFAGKDIKRIFDCGAGYFRINILGDSIRGPEETARLADLYRRLATGETSADDAEYTDFIEEMKEKGYNKGHFFRGV